MNPEDDHTSNMESIRACIGRRCLLVPEQAETLLAALGTERQAREAAEQELDRRTRDYQARLRRRDRIEAGQIARIATLGQERDAARAALRAEYGFLMAEIDRLTLGMAPDRAEKYHKTERVQRILAVLASAGEQPATSSSQGPDGYDPSEPAEQFSSAAETIAWLNADDEAATISSQESE